VHNSSEAKKAELKEMWKKKIKGERKKGRSFLGWNWALRTAEDSPSALIIDWPGHSSIP